MVWTHFDIDLLIKEMLNNNTLASLVREKGVVPFNINPRTGEIFGEKPVLFGSLRSIRVGGDIASTYQLFDMEYDNIQTFEGNIVYTRYAEWTKGGVLYCTQSTTGRHGQPFEDVISEVFPRSEVIDKKRAYDFAGIIPQLF